jgi:hypothetical protein
VVLGQDFSEYFSFSCQSSFKQMLHTHLSSGVGTIGQLVADVPSGLSLTPLHEIKFKIILVEFIYCIHSNSYSEPVVLSNCRCSPTVVRQRNGDPHTVLQTWNSREQQPTRETKKVHNSETKRENRERLAVNRAYDGTNEKLILLGKIYSLESMQRKLVIAESEKKIVI